MRRPHPVDHFELQHEMHVAHAIRKPRQVEKQRGRNVVRQVADHAQARGQGGEIEVERVGHDHVQPFRREFGGQRRGQVAVDLDRGELRQALEQRPGKGTFAGADFHKSIARLRRYRLDYPAEEVRVVEEVLAEALARDVTHARPGPKPSAGARARCRARGAGPRSGCPPPRGRCRQGRARCRGRPKCARWAIPGLRLRRARSSRT